MVKKKSTKKVKTSKKTKKEVKVSKVKVYISASFNNTLITITDLDGGALLWGSAGSSGFKGTRKATPFAATTAVEKVLSQAKENLEVEEIEVYIKGPGPGRDAALRAIRSSGLKVSQIADVTPFPHNGPRPKKKRRN